VCGAEAPCHFPCKLGCVTQNTCGNYNLDLDQNRRRWLLRPELHHQAWLRVRWGCLAPVVAYPYEYENNKYYTSEDCLLLRLVH
jgi:hypothetical protein